MRTSHRRSVAIPPTRKTHGSGRRNSCKRQIWQESCRCATVPAHQHPAESPWHRASAIGEPDGTRWAPGANRRSTGVAHSFSASPSANPEGTRKRRVYWLVLRARPYGSAVHRRFPPRRPDPDPRAGARHCPLGAARQPHAAHRHAGRRRAQAPDRAWPRRSADPGHGLLRHSDQRQSPQLPGPLWAAGDRRRHAARPAHPLAGAHVGLKEGGGRPQPGQRGQGRQRSPGPTDAVGRGRR